MRIGADNQSSGTPTEPRSVVGMPDVEARHCDWSDAAPDAVADSLADELADMRARSEARRARRRGDDAARIARATGLPLRDVREALRDGRTAADLGAA